MTNERIRDKNKVNEWIAERKEWEGVEQSIFDAYALYHSNYDSMSKYYPKFRDYWMKNHNWTDELYSKHFKDDNGNRQTLMRPVLDDNDYIVYRVVDDFRYREINKFCEDNFRTNRR